MFLLTLVTPEKRLVTDVEISEVIVPGFRGQLDILPGHAPLMTTLSTGILSYKLKGAATFEKVVVSWGYCQVNPEGVVILAETAESLEELDRERAEASRKLAKTRLIDPFLEADQIAKFQRKLERANARLDALGIHAGDVTSH
jgi:F-type H+-transporting ATPase subunit epsilon